VPPPAAVVVIGASWGGVEALTQIVRDLPQDFRIPVVIVQHRSSDSEPLLVELLESKSALLMSEPQHNEPLRDRHIYVAPADHHLRVGAGFLTLDADAPVRHSRPSIDVTFSSAAESYGERTIGVVLTGANADGSRGLRCIADHGGHAIIQDPPSAAMAIMPRAAIALVPEAIVLPIERIAAHLARVANDGSTPHSAQERRPRV
jgi:two-component system chemotaxis response regulator CheB